MPILKLAALAMALICLPGCFDYEAELTLRSDGSGQARFSLYLPAQAQTGWEEPLVARIVSPEADRRQIRENGRLLLREEAAFRFLGNLTAHRIKWNLSFLDSGFLGLGGHTYKLTTTVINSENIPSDRTVPPGLQAKPALNPNLPHDESGLAALALRVRAAGSHSIIIRQNLPGEVEEADSIFLGDYEVTPEIKANQVSWRLPLAMLVAQDVRYNLTFSCVFQGDYRPRPGLAEAWASRLPPAAPAKAEAAPEKRESGL
ncbi:MAG: hypothetical protein LBJ14_07330 [Desulfarculales bacterium]|jgi:hypothetical protein|nr:hypothetical protein [Desulfarculales bacterium]